MIYQLRFEQELSIKEIAEQLTRARTGLILDQPFFGRLAMMLHLVEDDSVPTLAVDGKSIFYNPEFVGKHDADQVKTMLAHEVMHCVYDHRNRRDERNPRTWNQAGDYVINLVLVDSGFAPITGWLYSTAYADMSTDEVYNMLPPPDENDGKDPMDEVLDGSPDDALNSATDWKVATIQAANTAKEFGKMPASLARLVEELTTPKVDWRALLRNFITERSKDDYSWMRPNRRFQSMGIMLPVASSGAILMPWVIGRVAEGAGLAAGMATNIIPCVGLCVFAVLVARER